MHILCVSFKLYLYNFNSRIYIQLVPKVSSLVFYSTQLFHSLSSSNNKLIEIKKSSSIIFLFLFPSFRTLSELKFQIWNLRSMRSNECHFFPHLSIFHQRNSDQSRPLRSIDRFSLDFISPPCISPLMLGWNVIASLSTTSLESNSSRDEAIKSTARLSFPSLASVTRVSNACLPINYRSFAAKRFIPRSIYFGRSWKLNFAESNFCFAEIRLDGMFIKNIVNRTCS